MLLSPSQAREARATLETLSRRFLGQRSGRAADPSLASGQAGVALAHAALDSVFPRRGHQALAARALERAIERLATGATPPTLYGGFAGVAWVSELLQGDPSAPDADDPCAPIDAALERYLAQSPWTAPYDLIEGLVGVGVYALERVHRPSAQRLVSLVVERLRETAEPRSPGVAWRTDPTWAAVEPPQPPPPVWDLGVAHGAPGVIALLGRVVGAKVPATTRRRARRLLEQAVDWVLAHVLPPHPASRGVEPGDDGRPSHLAWCYGDPGIAATLLVAGQGAREPAWVDAAVRVALRAAARESSTTNGAGLCHGAAGLAHVFHRLYLQTTERRFAKAARLWFERTLAMGRDPRGFGGFATRTRDASGRVRHRAEAGFLTGAAGVTLALVAATSDADPVWDRALLLS